MAVVSDVEIRLRADIAQLRQDMNNARREVGGAMDNITRMARGAGAALGAMAAVLSVGMFAGFIKEAIDATDAASDISQKTGVAVEQLAGLQLWFQKGGMEASDLDTALVKLSKKIAEGGNEFKQLGVATKDANGNLRSNTAVLMDSADAFAAMQDGTAKTAIAMQLFDKSGANLIPMLNEGSEGLRSMTEMADKLGLTFDQKVVDQAGEFNDTLSFLGLAAQGVGRQVAAELLPTLQSMAGSFLEFIVKSDMVKKAASGIATAFKVVYTAGVSIVTLFSAVGKVIGGTMAFITNNLATFFTAIKQGIEGDYAKAWETITTGGVKAGAILGSTFSSVKADLSAAAGTISDVWTGAGGETVAALTKVQKAGKYTSEEAAKDAKKQAEAYASLLAAARELAASTAREAAGMAPLNAAQKLNAELTAQLADGKVKLTATQEAGLRALYATAEANLAAVDAQKTYTDYMKEQVEIQKDLDKSRADTIKSATEEAEKNEQLAKTFGMTAAQIEQVALARLKEQLAQKDSDNLNTSEIAHLEALIALKERSAAAVASTQAMEESKQFWTDIDKTAHDTFVSIADGGKNAFQRLKDTAKNVFFDWLYQQTIKKWIVNIQANTSTSGASGIASLFGGSSDSGAGGGLSSISSLISMGKTIYSGFSGGIASTLGGYASSAGSLFGSTAMSSFGAGLSSPGTAAIMGELASGAAGATSGTAAAGSAAAGASAGAYAIPIAGWIAAGMALSKNLYSSGWQADNGSMNTLGNVVSSGSKILDSALRGIGLSKSTANMFSGMSTYVKLFGRKNPEVQSQGIEGTFGAGGFTGQAFADILEKGGWFRSDKRYTNRSALGSEQENAFDTTMTSMIVAVKGFGDAMGAQTSMIDGYSKQIKLTLTADQAANEKLIAETFGQIGDELALRLIPTITQFSQTGETAAATLQRITMNFQIIDGVLAAMGTDSQTAFRAVGTASIGARERLVTLAGGLDTLGTQVDFFTQNFLTQAEQIAPLQKQVNDQLAALGYAGLTTADQFKAAVLGLAQSGALATEAGAKTYAGLLAVAPGFKTVADYLVEIAGGSGLDALRARADDAMSVLSRSVDAQKDVVANAYDAAMAQLETSLDGVNEAIGRNSALSQALRGAVRGVDSPEQQAASRLTAGAQIATALAIAKASGVLPSADDLRDALSTIGADNGDQFATLAEYQRSTARMNSQLEQLGGLTDDQLSTAERQLQALQEQRDMARAANETELARLDGLLTYGQAQLDAANGINNSVLSVGTAMNEVLFAVRELKAANGGFVGQLTGYAPPLAGPVSSGVPMVASVPQSGTMGGSAAAMQATLEKMEQRLASIETTNTQSAQASAQTAQLLNNVTAGGNAMLTEQMA